MTSQILRNQPLPLATSVEIRAASLTTPDEVIPALAFTFITTDDQQVHIMFACETDGMEEFARLVKKAVQETLIQASLI